MKVNNINKKRKYIINYFKNTIIPIILYGGIIGILVGVVVWSYSFAAEHLYKWCISIYQIVGERLIYLPLLLLGLAILATLVYFIFKFVPEVKGGGVPHTEGVMRGLYTFRWFRVLIGTIISSFITYFSGLPLGSEGPSIQIGGTIGQGVNEGGKKINKHSGAWKRLSVTGGASAGLATAFNAPLTGIVFALEEGHKRFSPMILLTAASSVIFATITSVLLRSWVGNELYVFNVGVIENIPIRKIWILGLLGIAIGFSASIFSSILFRAKELSIKYNKIPLLVRLILAFVIVGVIGVFVNDILGGGGALVKSIAKMDFTWQLLLGLLLLKVVLIVICVNAGATGGLFVPTLALGALVGGLFGHLFIKMGMEEIYYKAVVVISMCAFMGAVMRSPLTAIVLVVEVTGQFLTGFLTIAIVILLAYFIVELLDVEPLYDYQLTLIMKDKSKGTPPQQFYTFEVEVEDGAFAVGRTVRDILWPPQCIVIKINKKDSEGHISVQMDRDGERSIRAGDRYTIQTQTNNIEYVKKCLDELIKNLHQT